MIAGRIFVVVVSLINIDKGKATSVLSSLSWGWSGRRESASALFNIPDLCLMKISYCMIRVTACLALCESRWDCR